MPLIQSDPDPSEPLTKASEASMKIACWCHSMVCRAPKCHSTRPGCRCPNPWLEYMSRTARLRREQRQPRASRAQHSQLYGAAKAAGDFLVPPGLDAAPCKSDVFKLCAWMLRRKAAVRDVHGAFLRAQTERAVRQIAGRLRPLPPDSERHTPMSDHSGLRAQGVTVYGRLGGGVFGDVYYGMRQAAGRQYRVAIKVVQLREAAEPTAVDFQREVHMQRVFGQRAGVRAPLIYDAYIAHKRGNKRVGTFVGVVNALPLSGGTDALLYLARQLKALISTLSAASLLHGDMHTGNIGFQWRAGLPLGTMIDFGRAAVANAAPAYDTTWVWRASMFLPRLNSALHTVGFPASPHMQAICGQSKPLYTPHIAQTVLQHDYRPILDAQEQLHRQCPAPALPHVRVGRRAR